MVLYIEDQWDENLFKDLQEEGFEVIVKENGDEAIKALNAHNDRIKAILLDIMMPPGEELEKIIHKLDILPRVLPGNKSGIAFLEYLRIKEIKIPVVVLTANPVPEIEEEAVKRGVKKYILKSSEEVSSIYIAEQIRKAIEG